MTTTAKLVTHTKVIWNLGGEESCSQKQRGCRAVWSLASKERVYRAEESKEPALSRLVAEEADRMGTLSADRTDSSV